jgi:formylglycine-generating enzyme required for sulfatase activity
MGYNLKFVRIKPDKNANVIDIAIRENTAKDFYQQAESILKSDAPLHPFILRSVSEQPVTKVISEFWIQAEPMSEDLYKKFVPDGSVSSVSYNDAIRLIDRLNESCGEYKFELPTEEQLTYLAKTIYNPTNKVTKLTHCYNLKKRESKNGVKQLLGNRWQLTQSKCEQWSEPFYNEPCYVKKGGTVNSKDPTECIPEYRAESSPDVREPDTTIRLVLLPPSTI